MSTTVQLKSSVNKQMLQAWSETRFTNTIYCTDLDLQLMMTSKALRTTGCHSLGMLRCLLPRK